MEVTDDKKDDNAGDTNVLTLVEKKNTPFKNAKHYTSFDADLKLFSWFQ